MAHAYAIYKTSDPTLWEVKTTFKTADVDVDRLFDPVPDAYVSDLRKRKPQLYATRTDVDFVILEEAAYWTKQERLDVAADWKKRPADVEAKIRADVTSKKWRRHPLQLPAPRTDSTDAAQRSTAAPRFACVVGSTSMSTSGQQNEINPEMERERRELLDEFFRVQTIEDPAARCAAQTELERRVLEYDRRCIKPSDNEETLFD